MKESRVSITPTSDLEKACSTHQIGRPIILLGIELHRTEFFSVIKKEENMCTFIEKPGILPILTQIILIPKIWLV